jgi:hypothetical protein
MNTDFNSLIEFVKKIPSINQNIGSGIYDDGNWWIKFSIDIANPFSWTVVQELGHVVNHVSLEEPLPTSFYPVSPPPYMNGGPKDFLSWIIESRNLEFSPNDMLEWLKGKLPNPVDDLNQWNLEQE